MASENCKKCICQTCKNNFVNKEVYENPCENCYKCCNMDASKKANYSLSSCSKYCLAEVHAERRRKYLEKLLGKENKYG